MERKSSNNIANKFFDWNHRASVNSDVLRQHKLGIEKHGVLIYSFTAD